MLELTRADGRRYKPLQDLMQQAREFLDALISKHPVDGNDTVLIVGHNAILRCLIVTMLGEPEQGFGGSDSTMHRSRFSTSAPKVMAIRCKSSASTARLTSNPLPSKGKGARLILVRHGETNWNRDGRFQGQIDIPLNSNGHAQAEAARGFLADVPIQKAISSSMTRPRETAEGILKSHPGVTLEQTDGLVEIGHGLWEGKLESEIKAEWGALLEEWKRTPETVQMPEGETIQDVWDRSVQSWNTIANDLDAAETALVVAHDAVNKTILCHLLGLTPADIWAVKQGNGGVTVVDMPTEPGQPAVVACLNLTSHLGGDLYRTASGAL